MSTGTWITALVVGILGPCVGLWYWLVRTPPTHKDQVSSAWLDDHLRGRRD